jgi:hypothetical protein
MQTTIASPKTYAPSRKLFVTLSAKSGPQPTSSNCLYDSILKLWDKCTFLRRHYMK